MSNELETSLRNRIADLENENRRLRAELCDSAATAIIEAVCCGEKLTCNICGKPQPCLCGNGIFETNP